MSEINIIIDESGSMNNINQNKHSWTNYFVIGGYIVDNIGLISLNANFLKKELEIKRKNERHYKKIDEIKGVNIVPNDCAIILKNIINNIKSFIPFSIVICKKHCIKKTWNENGAFNYFLKCLIIFLIKNKVINYDENQNIKILLDNRGRKTPFRNELKEYLEQELYLEVLNEAKKLTFNIEYKDSKMNAYIRCADLIAYSILKFHENKSKRDKKFIKALDNKKINLHENKNIFPKYCSDKMCIAYFSHIQQAITYLDID